MAKQKAEADISNPSSDTGQTDTAASASGKPESKIYMQFNAQGRRLIVESEDVVRCRAIAGQALKTTEFEAILTLKHKPKPGTMVARDLGGDYIITSQKEYRA